jgi:hypothetical protein
MTTTAAAIAAGEEFYERHRVRMIYEGSDGDATRALYDELAAKGPIGIVAVNLFRAQKCSARAKVYHSGHYATLAYGRKGWSLDRLVDVLLTSPDVGLRFGWGRDPDSPQIPWVLYIDLPQGQVSFHALVKGNGPMYPAAWDGVPDASAERIIAFVNSVLHAGVAQDRAPDQTEDPAQPSGEPADNPEDEQGRAVPPAYPSERHHDQERGTRRRGARRRLSRTQRR